MGGKKKGGGKKGDADGEDKYDPAQMTIILAAQVQSLKERLASEQERRDAARASVEESRVNEQETLKQVEGVKGATQEIVRKMTQSYNDLEEEYLGKIAKKQDEIAAQKDQIRDKQSLLARKRQEKEAMTAQKDDEIAELKKRIDEMSSDFAEMLKDTLTKMQERIEFANKDWEDKNDISMLKKFEDMPGR